MDSMRNTHTGPPTDRLTPEERTMRGRLAAHKMHSMYDSAETTAAGRAKFLSRFEREVDPDGLLTPEERARRAEHAKRSYFIGLAFKSAQSRRRSAAAGDAA
jgi:hypothetical protein